MLCVDTEDDSCGNVSIINFFDGNKHTTFTGDNCRYKAWGFLYGLKRETIWGVNIPYDLNNVFGPWLKQLMTLQYVRSQFMRGTMKGASVTFFDTLRHWAASVEEMGKVIGVPKLSMPHSGCTCDDCVEYCRRDTEIPWRFVSEMLSRYESLGLFTIRSTLPSMALQLFKQFYTKEFIEVDSYILRLMRKAYYGGRVEVYRTGEITGRINHYDVNSLFPSVMRENVFPDTDSLYLTEKPDFNREGIFEGMVYIPYNNFPSLPVRDEELIFPIGQVYGSWPYPEMRRLIEDGGRVVSCRQAVEFEETEEPFKNYVEFCYRKRKEASNKLDDTFWKLMLNSLYGKFGQGADLEVIHNGEAKTINAKAKHANVVWSAYVTSYARLRLLDYLRSCESCFYTDTDSLFTFDDLPVSEELGALKLEGVYKYTWFKGNKLYCVESDDGKSYTKAKGVPRKSAEEFFRTGRATFQRPLKLKEAWKRGMQPNLWMEHEKELHKEYTKRKINGDGSTSPWQILEYRQRVKDGII